MAKNDPADPPVITEDPRAAELAELDALRAENARLADENADLRADLDERPVTFTTDAPRELTDTEKRQAAARRERAVLERSEGFRLDQEQQENAKAADAPARDVLRSGDDEFDGE